MSLRRAIVEADTATMNVTAFCATHGISTWFFWDLRRRHQIEGDVVLEPKSRAPHHVPNKTPTAVEDAIVAKRKALADAGLDAGAGTIAWHLADLVGLPSEATIWRILKARGFITPEPAKAPRASLRSFTAERANDCWQLDDTSWELADGTAVKILNVIDDHSRLLVASTALESCTGEAALLVLATAASVLGWPARFLSDNARAFRSILAKGLAPFGVAAGHSRPYHPQTCGKVERFHQTLKRRIAKQPAPASLAELQTQLDIFRHLYNHDRPHRSIGRKTPAAVWTAAPKNGPGTQPIGATTRVHTGTVIQGRFPLGKRNRVSIGARHNGKQVLAITTGDHCHVFIEGQLVDELTIDWTRDIQRLNNRTRTHREG